MSRKMILAWRWLRESATLRWVPQDDFDPGHSIDTDSANQANIPADVAVLLH